MRLPLTPSGLTMDRVRSSAIRFDLIEKSPGAGRFAPARAAGAQASGAVYLGSLTRGNLACDGSAGLVRVFAPGKPSGHGTRRAALEGASDGEALPAAAFALDVRVSEAEGLVQALLDEVHGRAVEQAQACPGNEHPHPAVFELGIPRLRAVGVVDHVGKARAAGLAHTEPQADAMPTCREEALDPICSRFRQ